MCDLRGYWLLRRLTAGRSSRRRLKPRPAPPCKGPRWQAGSFRNLAGDEQCRLEPRGSRRVPRCSCGRALSKADRSPISPPLLRRGTRIQEPATADPKRSATCLASRGSCTRTSRFRSSRSPKGDDAVRVRACDALHPYQGTAHPPGHIDWYMGDSRGRWDGAPLVVDVILSAGDVARPAGIFTATPSTSSSVTRCSTRITSTTSDDRGSEGLHAAVEN